MKGGGTETELTQSPLCANVLFIKRVSEISCEVVGEGPKERRSEDSGGDGRTKYPMHSCSLGLWSPAPALLLTTRCPGRDGALRWLEVRVGKPRGGAWGLGLLCCGPGVRRQAVFLRKLKAKRKSFLLTRPRPEPKVQVPQAKFLDFLIGSWIFISRIL